MLLRTSLPILLATTLLLGCRGQGPNAAASLRLTPDAYPHTDGARELRPLLRLAACRVMALAHEWTDTVGPDGKGREVVLVGDLDLRRARERILAEKAKATGVAEAYSALIEGEAGLILVTRPPTDAELRRARERGVEIDAQPVALDALVFLVHRDTNASALRVRQAREVYAGRITNWSDLGGPDLPITVFRRNRSAPSEMLMQRLVMKGDPTADLPEDKLVQTLDGPIGSVSLKIGSLSYTRLPNARHQAESERIKFASADGAPADSDSIRSRQYPLASEIFVATKKLSPDLESTPPIQLRRWLLSPTGQKAVEDAGYAAVQPR